MTVPHRPVPVAFLLLLAFAGGARAQGALFDGETLRGWRGDPAFWSVEDGAIVGRSTAERPCERNAYLVSDAPPAADFDLTFEFWIDGGNSGLQFRSRFDGPGDPIGYQADLEDGPDWTGGIHETGRRGVLARRGSLTVAGADGARATPLDPRPGPELWTPRTWHTYRIRAVGARVELYLDGVRSCTLEDRDPDRLRAGRFALQLHAGPPMEVRLRDLRLTRLDGEFAEPGAVGLYGASTEVPRGTSVEIDGRAFGAAADGLGPIGGGTGYRAGDGRRDHVARDLDGLLAALGAAKPGETVFLPGDAVIDCTAPVFTDSMVLEVPAGVTLASDRGVAGSAGALLFSDALATRPLIRVAGDGARISGLRLRGPDAERRLDHHRRAYLGGETRDPGAYYALPTSDGIETRAAGLEVDNCELAGWSHAAVFLRGGKGHRVHHCFIHHNQRQGLGYGVCLDVAEADITHNLFDWNRHSIAGTGRPGSGYRAAHNLERGVSLSHLFDMHGGRDRGDGTDVAGTWILVERNTFLCPRTALVVRGEPEREARFEGNWCVHAGPGEAVRGGVRTTLGENAYGAEAPAVVAGEGR